MKKMAVMVITAGFMFGAYAKTDARLLALWSMNEETNTTTLYDSSGNGRHATMDASVSIQDGLFGKAAFFPGIYGEGVATASLPVFSNLTVAAWVYYTASTSTSPRFIECRACVIHFLPGTLATKPVQFNVTVPGELYTGTWQLPGNGFASNKWVHVAVTYCAEATNNVPVLYLDGLRQSPPTSGKVPTAPTFTAGAVAIGNTTGKTREFGGKFDDYRIYNSVLTDREIYALFTDRPPQADPGPAQTVTRSETLLSGQLVNTNPFIPDFTAEHLWQQVSGPAAVIDRSDRLETGVTLPEIGIYQFALSVSNALNGAVYTSQVMRVASVSGNAAPVVATTASETTCVRPFNALLKGTVSDDGNPVASALVRKRWRKVSGPGGVFFDAPYALTTQAGFSAPGTYVVALDADDGDMTGSATATVTVTDTEDEAPSPDAFWEVAR